jgi:hypothetical protein
LNSENRCDDDDEKGYPQKDLHDSYLLSVFIRDRVTITKNSPSKDGRDGRVEKVLERQPHIGEIQTFHILEITPCSVSAG